jgi:hypothetical protein
MKHGKETQMLQTKVMTVTPELAAKWLEGNTHNRPLYQRAVERYTAQMKASRWKLNGESIIFGDDGRLLDGQHRLWACVESQCTFESVVVTGANADAFLTIDQGKHRSVADHISVAKIGEGSGTSTKTVAAAAHLVIQYRTNSLFSTFASDPTEIIRLLQTEPGLIQWVAKAQRAPNGLKGFASPIAATLHVGALTHDEDADTFVHKWVSGADLEPGNPILTLRQRVMSMPPHKAWERMFLVASVWNAFIQQRPLYKMGSLRGDKFPRIEGDPR